MKFGALWRARVQEFPAELRNDAICYKNLKKTVKAQLPAEVFLGRLQEACERVHRRFLKELRVTDVLGERRGSGGGAGGVGCCASVAAASVAVAPEREGEGERDRDELAQLYAFAELNRTCLYKICKRYDKRAGPPEPTASPWCREVIGRGAYAFLNPLWLKRIQLELHGASGEECPVCLEPLGGATEAAAAMVLNCGHLLCLGCAQELHELRKIHGVFRNRIAVAQFRKDVKCPICRLPNPLDRIGPVNVYPGMYARILSEFA